MTQEDKGHFAKKHPGAELDERIAREMRAQVKEGGLFCAVGFKIARDLSVTLDDIGQTADLLELPILKCRLGLFGYGSQKKVVEPAESVDANLEAAIQKELVNDRLPCARSFVIAENFGITKMQVASACEKLDIRISACQLGAF